MKKKLSSLLNKVSKVNITQKAPPAKAASVSRLETLTKKQVKELTARLETLKEELLGKINGKAGTFQIGLEAESLIKGDDAEVAEKQRASNAALQELDFLKNRLALVERALVKIAAGAYGLCEETDEPIGYERLSVVPWARYSVHVQELRERRMREFRVSRLRSEV
jgi:DnaK suppressor protein